MIRAAFIIAVTLAPLSASANDWQGLDFSKPFSPQASAPRPGAKPYTPPKTMHGWLREPAGTGMPVTGPQFFAHEYDPAELLVEQNNRFCARGDLTRKQRMTYCRSI